MVWSHLPALPRFSRPLPSDQIPEARSLVEVVMSRE